MSLIERSMGQLAIVNVRKARLIAGRRGCYRSASQAALGHTEPINARPDVFSPSR